jgi:hypothetical protein
MTLFKTFRPEAKPGIAAGGYGIRIDLGIIEMDVDVRRSYELKKSSPWKQLRLRYYD